MEFYLHKLAKGMLNTYTQSVIKKLCQVNGHELSEDTGVMETDYSKELKLWFHK